MRLMLPEVSVAATAATVLDNDCKMFGDCSETTEEMTVDSRDSKDFNPNDECDNRAHRSTTNSPTNETDIEMGDGGAIGEEHTDSNSKSESPSIEKLSRPASSEKVNIPTKSPGSTENIVKCEDQESKTMDDSSHSHAYAHEISELEDARMESSPRPRADTTPTCVDVSPANAIPKLRLNTLLASDPALKPDAKDLKVLHEESQSHQRLSQMSPAPCMSVQQPQEEPMDAMTVVPGGNLVEHSPVMKSVSAVDMQPRIKVFMCMPCGIGFSSPSTLEAHQAYYCSHRHKEIDDESSLVSVTADKSSSLSGSPNGAVSSSSSGAVHGITGSGNGAGGASEPATKSLKTGKQYACSQCSYSADKKVSLNRHMRMHQASPAASLNASNGAVASDDSSSQVDRYCSDCDIRFNNVKTYRAHKQHYCSSRRTEGQVTPKLEVSTGAGIAKPSAVTGAISPQGRNVKTPNAAMVAAAAAAAAAASLQTPPQPFLALPTNPILIVPYALIRSASLIPGPLTNSTSGIVNPETTCFMLDNCALKPLATALNMGALSGGSSNTGTTTKSTTPSSTSNHMSSMETTQRATPLLSNSGESAVLLTEKNASRNLDANDLPSKRKEGVNRESAPLDLSLRRSPIAALLQRQRLRTASVFLNPEMETLLEAGKENLSIDESGSITPEQIVCAPSLPNSPSLSPSPKRRAISPRSSGAGSNASMSPPACVPPPTTNSLVAAAATSNLLESLPLRSMLPADIALKLSESNIINPLLVKQNLELAMKLSAAAVAANCSAAAGAGSTSAELAAAAVAAAGKTSGLLGLSSGSPSSGSSNQPQIYVKQGVSKCKECNIVFCKYENYLAHKQHYCSARNQDVAEVGTGSDSKTASSSPLLGAAGTSETTPVAYQQLICAACGIKYTSLDNLRAHQNYYCPKGGGGASAGAIDVPPLTLSKEKCNKCKTMHESGASCPAAAPTATVAQPATAVASSPSGQNVYKCPVCDAISLSATESRKHMETHGTVKAFRCIICRYKGNTLRGMRTHIRMHFDKKTTDFNEEHYMSCILEDDGVELPSAATLTQEQLVQQMAVVQQQHQHLQQQQQHLQQQQHKQQQQQQQQIQGQMPMAPVQVHNCEMCNYSSSYKGNVLRHMKLMHPGIIGSSPSLSPETGVGDLDAASDGASLSSSLNGDATGSQSSSFNIKTEPLDVSATNLPSNTLPNNSNNSPAPPAVELLSRIKAEPLDINVDDAAASSAPPSRSQPPASPVSPPLTAVATHLPPANATSSPSGENALAVAAAAAAAQMNQKYCHTCDISFNYMKTFLAHKQFYCKGKPRRAGESNDETGNGGVSMGVGVGVGMSQSQGLLPHKNNKENQHHLQPEAAI